MHLLIAAFNILSYKVYTGVYSDINTKITGNNTFSKKSSSVNITYGYSVKEAIAIEQQKQSFLTPAVADDGSLQISGYWGKDQNTSYALVKLIVSKDNIYLCLLLCVLWA